MSSPSVTELDTNGGRKRSLSVQEVKTNDVLDSTLRITIESALTRKLDLRLMPIFALIFMMHNMDRNAVAAARLQGLEMHLGLSGVRYNAVVAILYSSATPVPILYNMVWPWNIIILSCLFIITYRNRACVVVWGIASVLIGVTNNFTGIMICRAFLGVAEAAFLPGGVYILSNWYTRKQLAFRIAILSCGSFISNAFGSLVAAGVLGRMEGERGLPAWRWLFFIEGSITIVLGLMAMIILPDCARDTRWLSASELHLARVRLAEEVGEADQDTSQDSAWTGLKMAITDVRVLLFIMKAFMASISSGFGNFFPTLAATLGYPTTITLLLTAPPWIFALIFSLINALSADRTGERFFHYAFWHFVGILGFIIGISTSAIGARYFMLYLLASSFAGVLLGPVWLTNTISRPPAKRAAAIGLVGTCSNIGLIIGSFVWKGTWGPTYHNSMIISLCCAVLSMSVALVIRQKLIRENRALDAQESLLLCGPNRERIEEFARLEGITFEEALVRKNGLRYLY
ncbi:major facilitator superfamily domain-containing protein [Hysterangium stoloniferum]|nr:major facilitator superfamily domain-containing protein [Hysterangium stoloniferum]